MACKGLGDIANRDTDTSIVATSIYTIALDFNSLSGSLWVVLAYTLAFICSWSLLDDKYFLQSQKLML